MGTTLPTCCPPTPGRRPFCSTWERGRVYLTCSACGKRHPDPNPAQLDEVNACWTHDGKRLRGMR